MVRRGLGWVLALALLVGGTAACSDGDGEAGTGSDAPAAAVEGGGDSGATGNAEVDAYCAAVDEYRVAVEAQLADTQDMAAQDRAIELSQGLAPKLQAVGDVMQLDPEVASVLEECMIRAAAG